MTDALATQPNLAAAIEQVLIKGDLSGLNDAQRLAHYKNVCNSLGLNPLTVPFGYLTLQGKMILYAKREATEQLRKIHGVSIVEIQTQRHEDVYIVTAKAIDKTGRSDASTGAVPLGNIRGEALANALMKAETKAKRRVTLSICGLGMLDESEVDSVPQARVQPTMTVTASAMPEQTPRALETPADVPSTVDAPAPAEDDMVLIVRVDPGRGALKGVLVTSTGEEYKLYADDLKTLAVEMCEKREPVSIKTQKNASGTNVYVTEIVRLGAVPGDVDPLPF